MVHVGRTALREDDHLLGAFFIAWAAPHPVLKGKFLAPRKVFIWTGILVTIGIVLTFPIFFQLFAPAE